MIAKLLRLASFVICLIVIVSFLLFALNRTGSASKHQTEAIATGPSTTTSKSNSAKHESGVRKAIDEAFYDVTAISFHAYPYLQDNYALMACGGSVGEGYGPMIVARQSYTHDEIRKVRIAIPGVLTTAFLTLKIFEPAIETVVVPFDRIIPEILA